jgi:diaminopimelate epimerase
LKASFYKYHALGNDYIVIEPESKWFIPEMDRIKQICNRNYGVGSDGILYGPIIKDGEIHLKIFNPDGSEAEKSGNGLRIFAHHIFKRQFVKSSKFSIHLKNDTVEAEVLNPKGTEIRVNMGKASFDPKAIPISNENPWVNKNIETAFGDFEFTCLSVGNPHAVFFPKNWEENLILKIGPLIEKHPLFQNRTNVQMAKVIDNKTIEIRIWERGAGYTLASGSSACASAYVSNYLKYTSNDMNVIMPGGVINVKIQANGDIIMQGSVTSVFEGTML